MRTLRAELLVRRHRSRDEARCACVPVRRARRGRAKAARARASRTSARAPQAYLLICTPQATATPRLRGVALWRGATRRARAWPGGSRAACTSCACARPGRGHRGGPSEPRGVGFFRGARTAKARSRRLRRLRSDCGGRDERHPFVCWKRANSTVGDITSRARAPKAEHSGWSRFGVEAHRVTIWRARGTFGLFILGLERDRVNPPSGAPARAGAPLWVGRVWVSERRVGPQAARAARRGARQHFDSPFRVLGPF